MATLALTEAFLKVVPRAFWSVRKEMRRAITGGLSVPEFRVLGHLIQQALSNKELAELQGVSVAAMSRMVAGLKRRGLLQGRPNTNDRRQISLSLSPKGRQIHQRARVQAAQAFDRRFAVLGPAQRQALAEGLGVLDQLFPGLLAAEKVFSA